MLGQGREHFSVEHNFTFLECADKFAVGHAFLCQSRTYFGLPKLPVHDFLVASVGKSMHAGMEDRLFGLPFLFASAESVAFDLL
jgi:hypothetical protein